MESGGSKEEPGSFRKESWVSPLHAMGKTSLDSPDHSHFLPYYVLLVP